MGSPSLLGSYFWFMQLNPARGRKLSRSGFLHSRKYRRVYAAQPREGTETRHYLTDDITILGDEVYAAQPREGTETTYHNRCTRRASRARFMQLNPARGRKHIKTAAIPLKTFIMVYAAQPREGTETGNRLDCLLLLTYMVYAAQPREGTETFLKNLRATLLRRWFMQLNPARGRKLLCCAIYEARTFVVYAAQPREGTETRKPCSTTKDSRS